MPRGGGLDLLVSIPDEGSEGGLILVENLAGDLLEVLPPLLIALGLVALGGEDLAIDDKLDADVLDIDAGEGAAIEDAGDGAWADVHDGVEVAAARDIDVGDLAGEALAGEEDVIFDGDFIGPIDVGFEIDLDLEPLLGARGGVRDGTEVECNLRSEVDGWVDRFDVVIGATERGDGEQQETSECGGTDSHRGSRRMRGL